VEPVLPGLLEDGTLAVRQRLWFQYDGALAHCGKDVWQWLDVTYPRRWTGHRALTAWPPWLLDLTLKIIFLWGHKKRHIYAVSMRTVKDLMVRLQAALTTVHANITRHVRENSMWFTVPCLEMNGATSITYFNYEEPMI
jgi:hypothetical protein